MNPTLIAAILSATIPALVIILGILLNRSQYHKLDSKIYAKIDALRAEMYGGFDAVRAQQHSDMLRIYELFGEHSQRLARLETQVR